ncbi:MAG: citrate/2-methylcitrate synthase [Pseudomonadota bacterium]
MSNDVIFSRDLAGIEVGETHISDVKGEEGLLSYRGYSIESLATKPFWQIVWLVLFGSWPDADQDKALNEFMAANSQLPPEELQLLETLPRNLHPMLMLQGVVPLLQLKPAEQIAGLSETAHQGLLIAARIPSLVASWRQLQLGNTPLPSNPAVSFHENFLTMFNGHAPTADQVKVLDTAQILQMEHSFNAGTFAGRVCASTLAPIQSSISASIGTLFGVLHGGADQAALEMAQKIGSPALAADHVRNVLAQKQKIMGMGHREYKVVDPRARILKPMAKALCKSGEAKNLFEILEAVEAACQVEFSKSKKEIWANVEFYKGAVFHQLGIPSHYFTAIFAMARVYGYIAHYMEFSKDSCLIRPRARYVGNAI